MAAICGVDEVPDELTLVLTGAPSAGKSTVLNRTFGTEFRELREYRKRTVWGNAFRRPHRYALLTDPGVAPKFERRDAFGQPFRRLDR